jgi:DNA-binding XRE family transcriptional regulator
MHNLSVDERKTLLANINHNLLTGCQTLGQAARRIRTELYCMSQTRYAAFIGISEKTLWDIEKGNTDPKLSVLSEVFRPAGINVIAQAK